MSRRKIAQFIDDAPESLFVPTDQVLAQAAASGAIPYDVPGVELTHEGPLSSFDAILKKYELSDPCPLDLAVTQPRSESLSLKNI